MGKQIFIASKVKRLIVFKKNDDIMFMNISLEFLDVLPSSYTLKTTDITVKNFSIAGRHIVFPNDEVFSGRVYYDNGYKISFLNQGLLSFTRKNWPSGYLVSIDDRVADTVDDMELLAPKSGYAYLYAHDFGFFWLSRNRTLETAKCLLDGEFKTCNFLKLVKVEKCYTNILFVNGIPIGHTHIVWDRNPQYLKVSGQYFLKDIKYNPEEIKVSNVFTANQFEIVLRIGPEVYKGKMEIDEVGYYVSIDLFDLVTVLADGKPSCIEGSYKNNLIRYRRAQNKKCFEFFILEKMAGGVCLLGKSKVSFYGKKSTLLLGEHTVSFLSSDSEETKILISFSNGAPQSDHQRPEVLSGTRKIVYVAVLSIAVLYISLIAF